MQTSGSRIAVDTEHLGIRILMPLLTLFGFVGGYLLGRALIAQIDETISGLCVGLPLGFVTMIVLVQFGERVIKPMWHSGRSIELYDERLVLKDQRRGAHIGKDFYFARELKVDGWYFDVPVRKNRVPKGWFCVSFQLTQDEQSAIIYTFMSPDEARTMPRFDRLFERLVRTDKDGAGSPFMDARQKAHQKKLRTLEAERWHDGAEVSTEDFKLIVQALPGV